MTIQDLKAFGTELDALRRDVEAQIGPDDLRHVKRVDRVSKAMELTGRLLIHFSFEPITFGLGVVALFVHKQLQAAEIGHTVLHGAYDRIPGAHAYRSEGYRWQTPIDEASWHDGHNVAHHQYTNVVGRDPDCRYGPLRLNDRVAHVPAHRAQPYSTLLIWPGFTFFMATHVSGLNDVYTRRDGDFDFIAERSPATVKRAHRRFLRKAAPYYLKEYVLYPALAGPFFWKVMLGNWLSELLRSVYSAATIFCGHIGEHTAAYDDSRRAGSRAQWYAMQVESANNFEVPLPVSILCGALDKQIEHHLFPRFPTNRLRQIAPKVQEICQRHGVRYQTDSWPGTLRSVFRHLRALSRPSRALRRAA